MSEPAELSVVSLRADAVRAVLRAVHGAAAAAHVSRLLPPLLQRLRMETIGPGPVRLRGRAVRLLPSATGQTFAPQTPRGAPRTRPSMLLALAPSVDGRLRGSVFRRRLCMCKA